MQICFLTLVAIILNSSIGLTQNITWKEIQPPAGKNIDVWCINKQSDMFILCDSMLYISSDAGDHWFYSRKKADTSKAMSMAVSQEGYIYYVNGSTYRYRSLDSANSWDQSTPIGYVGPYPASSHIGIEITNNNWLLLQDSAHDPWYTMGPIDSLYRWLPFYLLKTGVARIMLSYSSDTEQIYVGYAKVEQWTAGGYHVYDGGIYGGSNNVYCGFALKDVSSLYIDYAGRASAVVEGSAFYTTSIKSKTWVERPITGGGQIISNQRGDLFLAKGQTILFWSAASAIWQNSSSGLPASNIAQMKMSETGYLFVGFANGQIYRSETPTTGVFQTHDMTPGQFFLFQNYPNPFNPQTEIEFDIDKASFVTLKIYDILSREMTTLVAQHLQPGHYTQIWDGTRNSSGVYFYTLQAGDSKQTKKLLLQK